MVSFRGDGERTVRRREVATSAWASRGVTAISPISPISRMHAVAPTAGQGECAARRAGGAGSRPPSTAPSRASYVRSPGGFAARGRARAPLSALRRARRRGVLRGAMRRDVRPRRQHSPFAAGLGARARGTYHGAALADVRLETPKGLLPSSSLSPCRRQRARVRREERQDRHRGRQSHPARGPSRALPSGARSMRRPRPPRGSTPSTTSWRSSRRAPIGRWSELTSAP